MHVASFIRTYGWIQVSPATCKNDVSLYKKGCPSFVFPLVSLLIQRETRHKKWNRDEQATKGFDGVDTVPPFTSSPHPESTPIEKKTKKHELIAPDQLKKQKNNRAKLAEVVADNGNRKSFR